MDAGVGDQHRAAAAERERDADDVAAGLGIDHAVHVLEDAGPVARHAGDHRIGVAVHDHQGREDVALVAHEALAIALQSSRGAADADREIR